MFDKYSVFAGQFERQAGTKKTHHTYWRHESGLVVSTELDTKWHNAEHPSDHSDFEYDDSGPSGMWRNEENRSEWEQEHREISVPRYTWDDTGARQWLRTLKNVSPQEAKGEYVRVGPDIRSAPEVIDFLTDEFEARFSRDPDDCRKCDGIGKICPSGHSNWQGEQFSYECDHDLVDCDYCGGDGVDDREYFTRDFGPFLSDEDSGVPDTPSEEELAVIQQGINGLVKRNDGDDPRPEQVLELVHAVVTRDGAVSEVVEALTPFVDNREVFVVNEDGYTKPTLEATADGRQEAQVQVMTTLNPDLSEGEARNLMG